MDNKQVVTNTITRELRDFAAPTGNIYETVMIIAKRSNQIAADIKQELSKKLELCRHARGDLRECGAD